MVQHQNNRAVWWEVSLPLLSHLLSFPCPLLSLGSCVTAHLKCMYKHIENCPPFLHTRWHTKCTFVYFGFLYLLTPSEGFKTILLLRYLLSASSYRQYADFRGTCREAQDTDISGLTSQFFRLGAQVHIKCGGHVTWCCLGWFRLPYKAHSTC